MEGVAWLLLSQKILSSAVLNSFSVVKGVLKGSFLDTKRNKLLSGAQLIINRVLSSEFSYVWFAIAWLNYLHIPREKLSQSGNFSWLLNSNKCSPITHTKSPNIKVCYISLIRLSSQTYPRCLIKTVSKHTPWGPKTVSRRISSHIKA